MGASFSDITLYSKTSYQVGTPEYLEQISLENFICDFYVQMMNGYKPPKTSRITIQPAYYDTWVKPWKLGSIISIAPYYSFENFISLDKKGKYLSILNLIHGAMLELSDEYNWDRSVFENAYKEIIKSDFVFQISYPKIISKDKKSVANICIEKSDTITSAFVFLETNGLTCKFKLFEKNNAWCYDCIYLLVKHAKWKDNSIFGIKYVKGKIEIWYSLQLNEVTFIENGNKVKSLDFKKYFAFG